MRRSFSRSFSLRVLPLAAFIGILFVGSSWADEKLAIFMRAKLQHSEKLLEGLAREDYDLIAKHSQAISLLCEDQAWNVVVTPEYLERSNDFRRSMNAITEAARKKNLEAAAFAYVDSTLKCVTCHKYVRGMQKSR